MQRCEITGRGITFGNQISHSHRVSSRVWKPNLQSTKIVIHGMTVKVKVCAKTLKTLKNLMMLKLCRFLKPTLIL